MPADVSGQHTFVALLRGVNVGKAKRVPMAELRRLLAELGYTGVATLLNSGNAVFRAGGSDTAAHAERIASSIRRELGLEVPVVVKTAQELDAIVAGNPLAEGAPDPARLLVAFTPSAAELSTLHAVGSLAGANERFVVGEHAAYLHCPDGVLQSRAGEALLGRAGRLVTTRNWATTLKLQALAGRAG